MDSSETKAAMADGIRLTLDEWLARFPDVGDKSIHDAVYTTHDGIFFDDGDYSEGLPASLLDVIDAYVDMPHPFDVKVYAHRKVTPEWARGVAVDMLYAHRTATDYDDALTSEDLLQIAISEYVEAWADVEDGFGNFVESNDPGDDGSSADDLRTLFVGGPPTPEALAELVTRWVERSVVYACDPTGEVIVVTTEDCARIWPKGAPA